MGRKSVLLLCIAMLLCLLLPFKAMAQDGTPVASVKGQTVNEGATINVTLTSTWVDKHGAVIRYTLDGSEPTVTAAEYRGTLSITTTTILKARAYYMGSFQYEQSPTLSVTYTFVNATPKADPRGGTYTMAQAVNLTSSLSGTEIYYTIDGTTPVMGEGSTKLYDRAIAVSAPMQIRAVAYWQGSQVNEFISEQYYVYKDICATPGIHPDGGVYERPVTVTLSCTTPQAQIWYVLGDSDDPLSDENAIRYQDPIIIGESVTLSVAATLKDYGPSIAKADFVIQGTQAFTPVASPKGGTYNDPQSVTLTTITPKATIWYTTNGDTPGDGKGERYTKPINITGYNTTLKAVTVREGLADSDVMTETYTISSAEPTGPMGNFVPRASYTRGQFKDVDENFWYGYDQQRVIARAFEYGLMKGDSDTIFNPEGLLTVAEAVTMAARIHSIYTTGSDNFVQGDVWYQVYVNYAIDKGIIRADHFSNYEFSATRGQVAYIFCNALPASAYPSRTGAKTPPDVTSETPYYKEIIALYDAGVLGGNDDLGTFYPYTYIIRAEVAAIAARVILPDTRLGR